MRPFPKVLNQLVDVASYKKLGVEDRIAVDQWIADAGFTIEDIQYVDARGQGFVEIGGVAQHIKDPTQIINHVDVEDALTIARDVLNNMATYQIDGQGVCWCEEYPSKDCTYHLCVDARKVYA